MQVDPPTEGQLAKLPEQLWPVAKRWGMPMLQFAITVSGTNISLDEMGKVSERFVKLQPHVTILLNNFSNLCEWVLESHGWSFTELQECIQDVGRANSLVVNRPRLIH